MGNSYNCEQVYFAFKSGSLKYDCNLCGKCCSNINIIDTPSHFISSPSLQNIQAFLATSHQSDPLLSFYNFADGCRFYKNGCELHFKQSKLAKPLVCQLFPFSRLIDIDGLLSLLPHQRCPWHASGDSPSEQSDYTQLYDILAELLSAGMQPIKIESHTFMPSNTRRKIEEKILQSLPDTTENVSEILFHIANKQAEISGPIITAPDLDLWLDLLRSAGSPPPLNIYDQNLLLASIPSLRILLSENLPFKAIPTALSAFELWLRTLAELGNLNLSGENLMHLFEMSRPLLKILTYAGLPVPWGQVHFPPILMQIRQIVRASDDLSLGELLLLYLRHDKYGAVSILAQLGAAFPAL
ncbi:MAG: YkgJ family cysteine cluster protein [Deltaproteobacteria bacterium]|nr:YkgJ family cysteine cluster protein [Deltaproteobacteria bacterium]